MNEKLPNDSTTLTELMGSPVVLRIVTILGITSLSILELSEYGLALRDINHAMANGVIRYDKPTKPLGSEETSALGIPLTGDYYYNFLNSKVKLTDVGLYILDSLKGNHLERKSSMILENQHSDIGPRRPSTIGYR
jgi:hypothetical protein